VTQEAHGGGAGALVVAHRGAWGEAPENSLAAFEHAIALGCAGIELDVRVTADHRLAVVHNPRIAGRPVSRLTLAQLRAALRPGQAPLLEEVLDMSAGRIMLDVELKELGGARHAASVVARRLDPSGYVITSFQEAALREARRGAPHARLGLLLGPRLRRRELEARLRRAEAQFVAPHVSLVRRGILDWSGERGLGSWLWTVNDARALRRLRADARVEAVITDRPQRALAAQR